MSRAARKFRRREHTEMGGAAGAGQTSISFHVDPDGRVTYEVVPLADTLAELESGEAELLDFDELCEGRLTCSQP